MKYGDKTFKAFILSIFKIQYYFQYSIFLKVPAQKRGSQGHLVAWTCGRSSGTGKALSWVSHYRLYKRGKQNLVSLWALHLKSKVIMSWNQKKKKKKFEWSAQASETLNKCTCIFTADNSSGISCCCATEGGRAQRHLWGREWIRRSRK